MQDIDGEQSKLPEINKPKTMIKQFSIKKIETVPEQ
jgi:hypothetical protein